jgi:eukaryotic-like serine/threonine-protein kinase
VQQIFLIGFGAGIPHDDLMNHHTETGAAKADERAEIIFSDALALPPGERQAFLADACGTDARLRAEVEEMLADNKAAGTFLSAEFPAARELGAEFGHPASEQPGDWIGPYRLMEKIGEGGFGTVWVAEQEKPVRRRVALKIIKPGMDSRQVIARFEQERQALAMMDHPNIARVLEAGATPLGRPFFVMGLVRGTRITQYCDEAGLGTADRLRLFIQTCHAVQHAHQKGIIHRDLKPSNILVTLHDGVPVPKVIDFGVAKAIQQQRLTDLTVYTQLQQMIGTPLYMSPEQAEMSGLDIDTRSDIYSLGVLLYELLTGTTPFDPQALLTAGLDEIRRLIRESDPPQPSTRLTQIRTATRSGKSNGSSPLINPKSSIDPDLDWIVMKALEKDRNRRYETPNGFALDIQRHLDSQPVHARPPSAAYRFRRFVRRNRIAFAASAAVLTALLAGLGASTWMYFKEKDARERAVAAEEAQENESKRANAEASKSREIAGLLKDMLKGVGPAVAQGRDTAMLREILDKTVEKIGSKLKDRPEVEAELRLTLGEVYRQLGDHAKAIEQQRRSLAMARELWNGDHVNKATAMAGLALALVEDGKFAEAESLQREALAMQKKLRGGEHPVVAKAMDNLAGMMRVQGRLVEAEALHREALELSKKLLGKDHEDVSACLNNLALVLHHQGKLDEAVAMEREVLSLARKQLGNDHPHVAATLSNLGAMLKQQEKLDEAESMHREALGIYRKINGDENRFVATSLNFLASVIEGQGLLDEAESMYRDVLEMRRKLLGHEHLEVATSLNNLAILFERKKNLPDAEAMHREALAMKQKLLPKGHPDLAISWYNLASVLAPQGKLAEAEDLHRRALAMSRKQLGDGHRAVARIFLKLANVLREQGKILEFESLVREELAIVRKLDIKDPPRLEAILADLADHLYRQEEFAEAESLYRELLENRKTRLSPEDSNVIGATASLARLLADRAWSERGSSADASNLKLEIADRAREAERLLRDCLAIQLRGLSATHWRTGEYRSRLGGALLSVAFTDPALTEEARLAKLSEAETELLQGNEALQQGEKVDSKYKRDSIIRLVRLYEASDKLDKLTEWLAKLAEFEKVDPEQ